MNTQSDANAPSSATRPIYWSVRRELWENRSIYLAPILVAVVVLLATTITTLGLAMTKQAAVMAKPFKMAPAPIMLTTFIVGLFYSLDALYGERRDRSILFWKSLPVSDRESVLAKMCVPLVVLPVIAFALSVIAQIALLIVSTLAALGAGLNPLTVWGELRFVSGLPIMFYGLAVHALWFAPLYGYFLLLSAWAKRAPFLWAVLPPVALIAVERIVFNTTYFGSLLQYRLAGAMAVAFRSPNGNYDRLAQLTPFRFLTTPGFWLGLVFTAVCLALAIRLRRNREPI